MTKRLDDIRWKADALGEALIAFGNELTVANDATTTEIVQWMSQAFHRMESLYWTLEKVKGATTRWEQEKGSSPASIIESAESIAALLFSESAPIVPASSLKNIIEQRESELLGTPMPSTLPAHPSLLPPSEKVTSSSTIPESAGAETATPTSESSSETGNE